MPLLFWAFTAGGAAGWWFLSEEPATPQEQNAKTLRIAIIAVLIIVALKFLKK